MSFFDSDHLDEEFSTYDNLETEIQSLKSTLEDGNIYEFIDHIEEIVQSCIETDRLEDGLFFIDKLINIFTV